MKKKYFAYLFLALVIAFYACNEPVFYMISVEPAIFKPLIDGSPTNFVVFENKVYAASGGNIHSYDGASWGLIPSRPGGRIMQLAATDNYLYALCYTDSGNNTSLKRISSSSENWEDVTGETGGYNMLQSVYAADDKVFIGAENNNYFIILYIDEANDSVLKPLTPGGTAEAPISLICGLACNDLNYYLCTRGSTIFVTPKNAPETISPRNIDNVRFAGIINLGNNTIVAISRDGNLYTVDSAITQVPNVSFGDRPSTGALAVWQDKDDPEIRLLLAGRQDRLDYTVNSGYTYGYLELELDSTSTTGIRADRNFVEPGKDFPSSVKDNERYVSTIGKYPVNHIFQAPEEIDANMTLFASTHKNGVWSYRDRGENWYWNAEE